MSGPNVTDMSIAQRAPVTRGVVIAALVTAAAVHIPVASSLLTRAPSMGVLVLLLITGFVAVAGSLATSSRALVPVLATLLSAAAIGGYVATRVVAFPGLGAEVGAWLSPLGVAALAAETVAGAAALRLVRVGPDPALDRPSFGSRIHTALLRVTRGRPVVDFGFRVAVVVKAVYGVGEIVVGVVLAAQGPTGAFAVFLAVYLIVHGLVKVVLLWAVLTHHPGVYPWAILLLSAFVAYQVVEIVVRFSVPLIALSVIDVIIIVLTFHEWELARPGVRRREGVRQTLTRGRGSGLTSILHLDASRRRRLDDEEGTRWTTPDSDPPA